MFNENHLKLTPPNSYILKLAKFTLLLSILKLISPNYSKDHVTQWKYSDFWSSSHPTPIFQISPNSPNCSTFQSSPHPTIPPKFRLTLPNRIMEWLFGQNFGFCNSVCCSFKPDSKSENQIFQLTQTTIWNSTKAEEEDSKKEQICNKSRDLSRLEYKQSISQFTISRGHFPRDFFYRLQYFIRSSSVSY